jgi:probable addiction module antidote protein
VSETFSRYDAADYLNTEDDIAAYLDAAAEEGDPAALVAALGAVARARNMSQLSRDAGMTREGLYKALSTTGNPSFATVAKIARALGFRLALHPAKGR